MDAPLFSVILATYDRQGLLDEAVASVLAQTITNFELLIVDDGSPVPARVTADPRVRLIRRIQNSGLAAARNIALEEAKGTFVCFVDDDDLYCPDRLALAARGHQQAPVAICWSAFVGANKGSGRRLHGWVQSEIFNNLTPSLGATSVRRDLVPRFDERYLAAQDLEWWLRLSAIAPVFTVPEVGYLVRNHEGLRRGNDATARIAWNTVLLNEHSMFFNAHPRAAAFRWRRIGHYAVRVADYETARRAFARSFVIRPSAKALGAAVRALIVRRA